MQIGDWSTLATYNALLATSSYPPWTSMGGGAVLTLYATCLSASSCPPGLLVCTYLQSI